MKLKILLGERVMVLPDASDEKTEGGIIIPENLNQKYYPVKSGIIVKKGTGTPWNRMTDIHVKEKIAWRSGAGIKYEEERDGHVAKYLILSYSEILFT
jgi:co-chaperonin GroES (HSP10)